MPDYTSHYHLLTLDAGESLATDNYAMTRRNWDNTDVKLYLGAEGHHHTGASAATVDPASPLSVVLVPNSGSIPGGRTIRYRYTLVDENGQETASSPESTVTTPSPVAAPGTPTLVRGTGGVLLPGNYFYVLTAYKNANTLETTGSARAYTTLNFGSNEKEVTIDFPTIPSGADGFNIYRRSPGSSRFQYLTSVATNVATPPTDFLDDGSLTEDCNRTIPNRNTTANSNSVTISLPGATPTVPDGYTWKIYRTYTINDWDASLLHWTVEETSEGSGIIVSTYTDVGRSTTTGKFPEHSEIAGSPAKVDLTDMNEVQGTVPVGSQIIPALLTFTFPGPLSAVSGEFIWVCDFDKAQIIKTRATLGKGSAPASVAVIADVQKYDAQLMSPTWASIYSNPANRPKVNVGSMIGSQYTLQTADTQILLNGDAVTVDINQVGGGATPTDEDLVVSILLYVQVGSLTTSHVWATS